MAPGFVGALRRSGADLFHFHVPHPTGELAYLLSRLKTPAVATYHSDVVRQRWAMAVYGPLFDRFLGRMHTIMPTSRRYLETSEWLVRHRERCRVVPLGYPLEDYAATPPVEARAAALRAEHGDFVLFLGCLRPYKGLFNLLMAMQRVAGARLLIAGEGSMREALARSIGELGLSERVQLLGRVENADAVALLHAAALVVLPSHQRSEAFGLVQIEAMACGTAVISTDLPTGVPEVNAHGVTGLVVPPQEPQALAEAIETLLGDEERRRTMGEAGRRRAETLYRAERMAEDVAGVYREVLGMR
jgi:rhamnosyl/mannosyltransferase